MSNPDALQSVLTTNPQIQQLMEVWLTTPTYDVHYFGSLFLA